MRNFNEEYLYTWITSLNNEQNSEIFNKFNKTVRNEIRRAEKEWIMYYINNNPNKEDLKSYYVFYNKFRKSKSLNPVSFSSILKYMGHIKITYSKIWNEILSYHLYLVDEEIKIVRLLQSCSLFRENCDKNNINMISYANKWLHYFDMTTLKDLWYKKYDWGGLYLWNNDFSKINIDKFKMSFAPDIIRLYKYNKINPIIKIFYSFYLWLWRIKNIVKTLWY